MLLLPEGGLQDGWRYRGAAQSGESLAPPFAPLPPPSCPTVFAEQCGAAAAALVSAALLDSQPLLLPLPPHATSQLPPQASCPEWQGGQGGTGLGYGGLASIALTARAASLPPPLLLSAEDLLVVLDAGLVAKPDGQQGEGQTSQPTRACQGRAAVSFGMATGQAVLTLSGLPQHRPETEGGVGGTSGAAQGHDASSRPAGCAAEGANGAQPTFPSLSPNALALAPAAASVPVPPPSSLASADDELVRALAAQISTSLTQLRDLQLRLQ